MAQSVLGAEGSRLMDNGQRGAAIKRRRLAIGIKSLREFAEATGVDRAALTKAEAGQGSTATYERVEAWLDRHEEETGHDEPAEPLRFTLHDVFGVGEIIVEGPADHPDELVQAVAKLLAEIQKRD